MVQPAAIRQRYSKLRGLDSNTGTQVGTPVGEVVGELARWLIITVVLARLLAVYGAADLTGALTFGAWMWVTIYTVLAGSVLHERYPGRLYAIHAGDGLARILLITTILAPWKSALDGFASGGSHDG